MSYRRRAVAVFVGMAIPTLAGAASLTFPNSQCSQSPDGSGPAVACNNSGFINQNYGDSSDIDITYRDLINSGNSLRWWDTQYNDLLGVAWGGNSDSVGGSLDRIEIKPLQGGTITLNGFDLGAFPSTVRDTHVRVLDLVTNAVLVDYGTQTIGTGNLSVHFSPNVSSANGVAIEWRDSAFNVGIDNIDFSVPEPARAVLLAAAMLGWIARRPRRSPVN